MNDNLTKVLVFALLAAGLFFTIATRGLQFRLFGLMWKVIFNSRSNAQGGISSFGIGAMPARLASKCTAARMAK